MSLNSALYAGVSGLSTYGNAMNVIGDNIANVNTVGFKGNKTIFADVLANQVANGSTTLQFGRGSLINDVSASWQQGSFETTGNATDAAIQGAGFFVLRNPDAGGSVSKLYTRAGQFTLDNNGQMVNPNDMLVQGYKLSTNSSGTVTAASASADIDVSGVQSTPKASTAFRLGINLDASASAGATFASSFNVYNALGEAVTVTYTFTKQVTAQTWDFAATASGGGTVTGAAQSGTMVFDSTGQASTIDGSAIGDLSMTVSGFSSGAANTTLTWNLVNDATSASYGDLTGYASDSVTNSVTQDGFSTGVLRGLSIDQKGILSGLFSNGQTQQLYQLELADFLSPWGLSRLGNSTYGETAQSGQPVLGTAQAGAFGSIYGSSLELSNVDLSAQFVDLIQNQRAYQANTRIISTVDQMLQDVVNLVR